MSAEIVQANGNGAALDQADVVHSLVVNGDVSKMSAEQRTQYYMQLCGSLGLNPLTKPFAVIKLNGKETMYALRDCTDQLRKIHRVSIQIVSREKLDDVYVVVARATMPDGRTDESTGAVPIANLKGDALANALMKAETKSKRRATLSIVGLGMLDESELETIPGARKEEGPRKKLEAPPAEPADLSIDEQVRKWGELLDACSQPEDLAKINKAIKEQGYSKEVKAKLIPLFTAASKRITGDA